MNPPGINRSIVVNRTHRYSHNIKSYSIILIFKQKVKGRISAIGRQKETVIN
jgi:hypothetical protein